EAVADADRDAAPRDQLDDLGSGLVRELEAHHLARQDVVAVGEAARDREDLVVGELRRPLEERLQRQDGRRRAALLEREGGLGVAVGAGGAEDEGARSGHPSSSPVRNARVRSGSPTCSSGRRPAPLTTTTGFAVSVPTTACGTPA